MKRFKYILVLSFFCSCKFNDDRNALPRVNRTILVEKQKSFGDGSYEIYYTDNYNRKYGNYRSFFVNNNLKENGFYFNDTLIGFYNLHDTNGLINTSIESIFVNGKKYVNGVIFYNDDRKLDSLKSSFISINGLNTSNIKLYKKDEIQFVPVVKGNFFDSIFYSIKFKYADGTSIEKNFHTGKSEFKIKVDSINNKYPLELLCKINILEFETDKIRSIVIYKNIELEDISSKSILTKPLIWLD